MCKFIKHLIAAWTISVAYTDKILGPKFVPGSVTVGETFTALVATKTTQYKHALRHSCTHALVIYVQACRKYKVEVGLDQPFWVSLYLLCNYIKLNKGNIQSCTMCFKTISRPTSGGNGGMTGWPFLKKSMGDFTRSNFEGAHHLLTGTKKGQIKDQ